MLLVLTKADQSGAPAEDVAGAARAWIEREGLDLELVETSALTGAGAAALLPAAVRRCRRRPPSAGWVATSDIMAPAPAPRGGGAAASLCCGARATPRPGTAQGD